MRSGSLAAISAGPLRPSPRSCTVWTSAQLPSCQRDVTTVPTQALALLNNPFVHEQSAALAKRIGTAGSPADKVQRAWQLTLGRAPRASELEVGIAHLEKQTRAFASRPAPAQDALASLCHVLLNCNEFVYVD